MLERRNVPPVAWVLSGAAGVAVTILAVALLVRQGQHAFFTAGDSKFFLLTTRDLFGTGHGYAAIDAASQIPYRYGRMGLPFTAWVLTLGRPAWAGWGLIVVNLVALTAIPGLTAALLADHDAPPAAAAFVFVLPAFVLLYGTVVSDPLVIALILVAYLLDARSYRRSAIATLAFAILVKEIAVLALVPLAWRAFRRHDLRDGRGSRARCCPTRPGASGSVCASACSRSSPTPSRAGARSVSRSAGSGTRCGTGRSRAPRSSVCSS